MGEFSAASTSRSCAITSRNFATRELLWQPLDWAICNTRGRFAKRLASIFRCWSMNGGRHTGRPGCGMRLYCICCVPRMRLRGKGRGRRERGSTGWGRIRFSWGEALSSGRGMWTCTYTSVRHLGITQRWEIYCALLEVKGEAASDGPGRLHEVNGVAIRADDGDVTFSEKVAEID